MVFGEEAATPSKAGGEGESGAEVDVTVYGLGLRVYAIRLKIAQKTYIVWSLGRNASKYESVEPSGYRLVFRE